jgi:hypothetical protein
MTRSKLTNINYCKVSSISGVFMTRSKLTNINYCKVSSISGVFMTKSKLTNNKPYTSVPFEQQFTLSDCWLSVTNQNVRPYELSPLLTVAIK